MSAPIRVLHIGDERQWRGGENQIRLLIEGSRSLGIENFVAYPAGTEALSRFEKITSTLALPSRKTFDFRCTNAIARFCKEHGIQILDAHSSRGMSWAIKVKARLPNLKLVVHRRMALPIRENWFSRSKYLNPAVDRFVAISKHIADVLRSGGVSSLKIAVACSAIETEPYKKIDRAQAAQDWRQKYKVADQIMLLGMASALTAEKGHREAILAVADLKAKGIQCMLLIAGAGGETEKLARLCQDRQLQEEVKFLGKLTDVREFVSALDVLLVPSHHEGLGTVVLEGMAAGTAVIGSDVGGIPEMIQNEATGLLVPAQKPDALADAIQRLAEAPALRLQLAERAQSYIQKNFSVRTMVQENVNVYRQLIGG